MRISPVEHKIPASYQYDALQSGWALQRSWHRARLDCVQELLPPSPHGLSLDAAAGAGIVGWRFRPACVVSTDIRPAACRFIVDNTGVATAAVATLSALPFRSGVFRSAYLLEVVEHLHTDDAIDVLRELRRVCQPRARCLITAPNYASHWGMLERVVDGLGLTPRMGGEQHISRYTAASLSQIVEKGRWAVVRSGTFNGLAPLAGLVSKAAGTWALKKELNGHSRLGALLYALCEPAA